ncbi:MAG TPA: efflux RND transporter periplasmic adaptor subunit [Vicinamibacterales bacterium]|nr:efflux RND transporter periplasmic adaptor subunit [Vicinamibacterales bacterium]
MRLPLAHALLVAALAAAGCGEGTRAAPPAQPPPDFVTLDDAAQRQAGITVAAVEATDIVEHTEAPGVLALDERRTARIGSHVDGVLIATAAEVGDRVRAGAVLATINSTVVHVAWAGYRKAVADRRRLEKELAFAIAGHERTQRLYANKAISLQDVQRAEADRVAAEQALDIGRTEVRRSEEELEHLGVTNADDPSGESGEQIPVRTPMSGVVLERLVTPGTAVTTGTPLYVVSDLSALWALVEIDESLLSRIRVGQPMQVRVAAYPGETFAGTVTLVGDTVNPKTRRVTVRCAVQNSDGRLKSQMYATALIRESAPRRAVVIPAAAVQTIDGRATIFVAEPQGRFRPRIVETRAAGEGMLEVRSGVRAGERIATAGTFILKSELLKSAAPEG